MIIGDRMSLIDEYVERRVRKAQERIILNLLKSGMSAEEIYKTADFPLSIVKAVEEKLNE